jgi:lysozyme
VGSGMNLLHGFDVSAFQGTSVPRADFIFVKAVEGAHYTSSKFDAQWADAKRKGMLRGAYCFARPEESPGASQADRLLAKAKAVPGEMLCLDLEASDLNQTNTNAWAKAFGDRLHAKAPGVTTVLYMGRGYASNNTGRDLSKYFDYWWMPQYPSTARTSTWPTSFHPAVPSPNNTGWPRPHIWQWTDNFNGLDASVSWLTLDQLAHGGHQPAPQPQEETMPYGGLLQPGKGTKANVSFPHGSMKAIGLVYDNPTPAQVRVAFHHKAGSGEVYTLKVGGPASTTDSWPHKTVQAFKTPADGDWVSLTRLDDGKDPVGWDMS